LIYQDIFIDVHRRPEVARYIIHTSGYMTSAVINSGVEQQVYHFYLFICDVNDVRTLDSRHRVFQCEIKMKLA